MRNLMKGLVLALIMALGCTSVSAQSREVYHGFVKDKSYLGRGGTPATLEQVAANPLSIFRSQLAYDNLRAHIGAEIGRPLFDADFRLLMLSTDVRLILCVGSIDTSGVTDAGRFGWHKRACYLGEMLIQVRLSDGRWLTVASQGCYNPVRGELPSLPPPVVISEPPPPKKLNCHIVSRRVAATPNSMPFTYLPGFVLPSCCPQCTSPTSVPGMLLQNNSSSKEDSEFFTVCD